MIELKDGMCFHNFMLDCKPREWFKRVEGETAVSWLGRVSYKVSEDSLVYSILSLNRYWLDDSFRISLSILTFLRENKLDKTELEALCGFELWLNGRHDWTIREIRKIEMETKLKLI